MTQLPRVVDDHGVVATVTVPDQGSAYIITGLRLRGQDTEIGRMGVVKSSRYWILDELTEPAVTLYCKNGKHDVVVPVDDLQEGVARYRQGESQVKIRVRFRRVTT